MDFNPDTWGTVADWVAGTATFAAFLATALVINRDARIRRAAQARRVVFYSSNFMAHTPMEDRWFVIRNNSEESIYDVFFYYHRGRQVEQGACQILHPGEETKYRSLQEPRMSFRDGAQVRWLRTLDGDLRSGRPKYGRWAREHRRRLTAASRRLH